MALDQEHLGLGFLGIDDVPIVGHADHWRRQVDIEAADRLRVAIGVVDDDDLAAPFVAADAAQQPAITGDHGNDLRAVRPDHDGTGFAADGLGLDVTRTIAEAIEIVAADILLPARVADDNAVRLVV